MTANDQPYNPPDAQLDEMPFHIPFVHAIESGALRPGPDGTMKWIRELAPDWWIDCAAASLENGQIFGTKIEALIIVAWILKLEGDQGGESMLKPLGDLLLAELMRRCGAIDWTPERERFPDYGQLNIRTLYPFPSGDPDKKTRWGMEKLALWRAHRAIGDPVPQFPDEYTDDEESDELSEDSSSQPPSSNGVAYRVGDLLGPFELRRPSGKQHPVLRLKVLDPDARKVAVALMYWATSDGKWAHDVDDIRRSCELSGPKLVEHIAKVVEVENLTSSCSYCRKPLRVVRRSEIRQAGIHEDCVRKQAEAKTAARQRARLRLAEAIERFERRDSSRSGTDALSIRRAVAILAVVRGGADESLSLVRPLSDFEIPLAPSPEMGFELVTDLYNAGYLGLHSDTSSDSVTLQGPDIVEFYPVRATYRLRLGDTFDQRHERLSLIRSALQAQSWAEDWQTEAERFKAELKVEEGLSYFAHVLEKHDIPLRPSEKSKSAVLQLLKSFSLGQIYCLMWRIARDAAAFRQREHTAPQHASNWAVVKLQESGERAIARSWNLAEYRRPFPLPESHVWTVFYDIAIRTDGVSERPIG